MSFLRSSWSVSRWLLKGIWTLVLWISWLLMGVVFTTQVYVAISHQLAVPPWMLRIVESRLKLSGLHASFGGAIFTPSGQVFVENIAVYAVTFDDPLLKLHTLSFRLDPWALLAGLIEPEGFRADGVDFFVPALLSPSGKTEPVIKDLYIAVDPGKHNILTLEHFAGRLANVAITARGSMALPHTVRRSTKETHAAIGEMVHAYLKVAQQIAAVMPRFAQVEAPKLDLVLTPDPAHLAQATISLSADAVVADGLLPRPVKSDSAPSPELRATHLEAHATTFISGASSVIQQLALDIGSVDLPTGEALRGIHMTATGAYLPDRFTFEPKALTASVFSASGRGIELNDLVARVAPKTWPALTVDLGFRTAGEVWQVDADGDFKEKSGTVHLLGHISDPLFAFIGDKIGVKLTEIVQPRLPPEIEVTAELGPDGKLRESHGRLAVQAVIARGVSLDSARADFSLSGNDLRVTDISLHQGDNSASGDYLMDTQTYDYRFLLDGRIRPIGISGWFKPWWPHFWSFFDFTIAPPIANVEVSGRWGSPETTVVFVGADCDQPVIRGVVFDHVVTTLFIRPDFYDALDLFVERGRRTARGTFTRTVDLEKDGFKTMDFNIVSNIDLAESARVFGREGTEIVEPFVFTTPPELNLIGHLEGLASFRGEHQLVLLDVQSTGPFTFYGFPLSDLAFKGKLSDDDLDLTEIHARFAGGQSQGKAKLVGKGDARRLGFDYRVDGANLGEAIRTTEQFAATRKGQPPPPESKFQQRLTNGHLSLSVSAEGNYNDPASYSGTGNAELTGAELAEINLLGALSQALRGISLLNFTSFKLTSVRANFSLGNDAMDFSDLRITGPTAAIDMKGHYSFESKQMDFNAKVYPFEQGKTLLANAVDLALTPFSRILELKLTGAIDQPNWRFAFGPTSLLRSLTGAKDESRTAELAPPPPVTADHKLAPPPLLRR